MRQITLHKNSTGRCPVEDYLCSKRNRMERAKILTALEYLGSLADPAEHLLKQLKGHANLWEVRVSEHRLIGFYTEPSQRELVLLHAFAKPGMKMQRHEIEVAAQRKAEYYPQVL